MGDGYGYSRGGSTRQATRTLFGNYQLDHELGLWSVRKKPCTLEDIYDHGDPRDENPLVMYCLDYKEVEDFKAEVLKRTKIDIDDDAVDKSKRLHAMRLAITGDPKGKTTEEKKSDKQCHLVRILTNSRSNQLHIAFTRGLLLFLVHKNMSQLNFVENEDFITVLVK